VIGLGVVLAIVTLPSIVAFAIAYRRVRASLDANVGISAAVPAATLVHGSARWTAGRSAQRFLRRLPALQAALVSLAIATIVFMTLTLVAMMTIAVVS
jgi:hypothetical protein